MGGPYNPIKTEYGGQVDYARLTAEKRAKAKKAMEEYNLEAVIACLHENCVYLSVGCHGTGADYRYVVFPITGEPIVHESGMADRATKLAIPEVKSHYAIPIPPGLLPWNKPAYDNQVKKWANQIKGELKASGIDISKARVGIDMADVTRIEALKAVGINVTTDGGPALRGARSIKTKDERELMRQACAVVEACFHTVLQKLRPGMTEKQIYGEIARTAWYSGAEGLDGGHVSSGPHSYPIAASMSDRLIRPGDIVLIDIFNLSFQGYRTCYYRNFSVGKPTEAQQDAWKRAVETTWDAIRQLKPGVSTKDLVRSWPKAENFGYPDGEDSAAMAQWAHGIGLSLYSDAPMVSRIWSTEYPEELKEGMILAIETEWPTGEVTGAYPQGQMLRIEEEIAITKDGYDVLSQWPIDEITVCWG